MKNMRTDSFSKPMKGKKKIKVVDPRSAKSARYRAILHDIQNEGVCPFCPKTFKWHTKPILRREGGWLITESFSPYKNTKHHFLIIKTKHKEHINELSPHDWQSIARLAAWAVKKFRIKGGALALRFGDTAFTGSSVCHIHAHLLVSKMKNGRAKIVWFPVG
jgi:diadenosine tetraphosphate (Ap4A) HIT family hydrolase